MPQAGDTVLVLDGASEARHVIIQLARHWGAKVLTTAASPMALHYLEQESAVSGLIDLSASGSSLASACLEATGGSVTPLTLRSAARSPRAFPSPTSTFALW
jgi:NADPH-dependent curcumin reductase CurA